MDQELEEKFKIRPYNASAYGEIVEIFETVSQEVQLRPYGTAGREAYEPKDAAEAVAVTKGKTDSINSRVVTFFGVGIIASITVFALLSFMGWTSSSAPNTHEDAMRLLLLILGGVLGSLYSAGNDRKSD